MSEIPFAEFYESLVKLAKSFEEKNLLVKIQPDLEANIIRIYGEKTDSLALAKTGLEGISELAYATAEHHPYWNLIFNSSQILKIVLEKWDDDLTKEELDEISWNADEIKNTAKKPEEK
ncbi:MAG: hypothetical protein ACREAD_02455 [Nitrosopumilaceae archaeon]